MGKVLFLSVDPVINFTTVRNNENTLELNTNKNTENHTHKDTQNNTNSNTENNTAEFNTNTTNNTNKNTENHTNKNTQNNTNSNSENNTTEFKTNTTNTTNTTECNTNNVIQNTKTYYTTNTLNSEDKTQQNNIKWDTKEVHVVISQNDFKSVEIQEYNDHNTTNYPTNPTNTNTPTNTNSTTNNPTNPTNTSTKQIDIENILKETARVIRVGDIVEIIGCVERNNIGLLRVVCLDLRVWRTYANKAYLLNKTTNNNNTSNDNTNNNPSNNNTTNNTKLNKTNIKTNNTTNTLTTVTQPHITENANNSVSHTYTATHNIQEVEKVEKVEKAEKADDFCDAFGNQPLCLFFRRGAQCPNQERCEYRHFFKDERERINAETRQAIHNSILSAEKDTSDPHERETKKHKANRSDLFVKWLLQIFKESQPKTILDVAGGRGNISFLLLSNNYECVLLEPRDHKFDKKKLKKLKKKNSIFAETPLEENFTHVQQCLDDEFLHSEEGRKIIEKVDFIIAMHPDEATEMVVDMALKWNKNFAVVPCCVFPKNALIFPRKLRDGRDVISYFEFVEYLLEKNGDIKVGYLDFLGRNKILYKLNNTKES